MLDPRGLPLLGKAQLQQVNLRIDQQGCVWVSAQCVQAMALAVAAQVVEAVLAALDERDKEHAKQGGGHGRQNTRLSC
mgnify:CR=1 FL=1